MSMITIISFSAFIIDPNMNSAEAGIMFQLINSVLPEYLSGGAVIGIVAVLFPSADSYMHSAGVGLSRDIIKPLSWKLNFRFNEMKSI